ncbi:MAG: aminoglycoside phosphotransferase family protein [Opitutus sp.]|nr:aminoglycoside phosphotransferase family protein [Opitutus sp.]
MADLTLPEPSGELASRIVAAERGWRPISVRRFTTGSGHYVYEAMGETEALVVRLGLPEQAEALAAGSALMRRLAGLGVPLPRLLGTGNADGFPYQLMDRLPGTDLGHVIGTLDDGQLAAIAGHVARAQQATARLGAGTRFGYAIATVDAPHATWFGVLEAHLGRSRQRMRRAGLFDLAVLDPVASRLDAMRPVLERQPAIPFLHDTTTKNVLIAAGQCTGIVDVDDLCWGDPRWAPALTLAVLKGYGGPQRYVAHWMAAAGHADDETFQLYVALFLLDLMAEHGQVFNGNETASTPEARAGLLTAFRDLAI